MTGLGLPTSTTSYSPPTAPGGQPPKEAFGAPYETLGEGSNLTEVLWGKVRVAGTREDTFSRLSEREGEERRAGPPETRRGRRKSGTDEQTQKKDRGREHGSGDGSPEERRDAGTNLAKVVVTPTPRVSRPSHF